MNEVLINNDERPEGQVIIFTIGFGKRKEEHFLKLICITLSRTPSQCNKKIQRDKNKGKGKLNSKNK